MIRAAGMLRPILILLSDFVGSRTGDPKRQAVFAGAGAIVALAGAVAAHIALAAAAFFLFAPALGAAGAAALAAVIVAAISAVGIGLIYWVARRGTGHGETSARLAERTDGAAVVGTVISVLLAGLIAGLDRKPVPDPRDRA